MYVELDMSHPKPYFNTLMLVRVTAQINVTHQSSPSLIINHNNSDKHHPSYHLIILNFIIHRLISLYHASKRLVGEMNDCDADCCIGLVGY